jgi:hypothetical protein
MLSENKKEFPFSLPFSAHRRLQPKSPKSADAPSFFSTGPLLLLRPQPSLAQIADPPDPVHPPPWPFTSPRGAHPGQIPSSPVSMAGTGGAGRRLPLGVRVVRACPTSCPVPYIVAPAEAPACPSPATRRLARPRRRRTLPVRRRPGPPPQTPPKPTKDSATPSRTFTAPPWRREATCAPLWHGRSSRPTVTFRRRRITVASHRLSHR